MTNKTSIIQPMLTDYYQITMAYAYWKANKYNEFASFDLFFRKNPFDGEFTIFAGLEDCLTFLTDFKFTEEDINYLKTILPSNVDQEFFQYILTLKTDNIKVYAPEEGTIMFPNVPLLRVEGPLLVAQLLETTLLNIVNYASLVSTNACRYRLAAGDSKQLIEMGLRRAQGPDGGLSASKYCYIGGFDATSNILAGKIFNIPVRGTQAHSYVSSFFDVNLMKNTILVSENGNKKVNMLQASLSFRESLGKQFNFNENETNDGELAAFINWAVTYPTNFVALIDTYEVLCSGIFNFCSVALALNEAGYKAVGFRLDSGDLAYLTRYCRGLLLEISEIYNLPWFADILIIVSNSLTDKTIASLNEQCFEIDGYGVGSHLVTCQSQPSLGCVYKLVELNGVATLKLTKDVEKVYIPGRKTAFRLYGQNLALVDLLMKYNSTPPQENVRILCRHPFIESKRAWVCPVKVEVLSKCVYENGQRLNCPKTLQEIKETMMCSLQTIRGDTLRFLNPTPYKVALTEDMYQFMHAIWCEKAPIGQLR